MSDQPSDPSSFPPPPQESSPGQYSPPPPPSGGFQPPPGTYQPPGTPAPILPTQMAGAGRGGFISQFRGNAGWACLLGIVTIAVPFIFGRVFFFLPIIGLILGVLAITRNKQVIGGIIGIVLNVIGGILTVLALLPSG